MTATDLLGLNKADDEEIERNRHRPGPAKDVFGLNKPTEQELEEDNSSNDK